MSENAPMTKGEDGRWVTATPVPPDPGYTAEVSGTGPYRWLVYRDLEMTDRGPVAIDVGSGKARTRIGAQLAIIRAVRRDKRRRPRGGGPR